MEEEWKTRKGVHHSEIHLAMKDKVIGRHVVTGKVRGSVEKQRFPVRVLNIPRTWDATQNIILDVPGPIRPVQYTAGLLGHTLNTRMAQMQKLKGRCTEREWNTNTVILAQNK